MELRLIAPELLAGFAVQRGHPVASRYRVDHPVYGQRGCLVAHGDIAALGDPGHGKLADVVLVDLIERAVAPRIGCSIVLRPIVGIFGARIRSEANACRAEQQRETDACHKRVSSHVIPPSNVSSPSQDSMSALAQDISARLTEAGR